MKRNLLILCLFAQFTCFGQEMPHNLSLADKIYGLSKFWQEVNYNFVYLDHVDHKAWDSTYRAMIPQVEQSPDDYAYYRLMLKFCALLKDGHTDITPPLSVDRLKYGKMFGKYWFALEEVDGKAIVTRVLKSEMNELPVGTELTAVNGIPARTYAKLYVEPYISSSTAYVRERQSIENLLSGLLGERYDVTFKRPDGKTFSLHLTHALTAATDFYPDIPKRPLLELQWYPGRIAYLALNSFADKAIDSMFIAKLPELYRARGLVIDLRNNGGGNGGVGTAILQYLMRDTIMPHARSFARENNSAYKAWGASINAKDTVNNPAVLQLWKSFHDRSEYAFAYTPDTIHLHARRLVVPTAVLTGNNTASAAEDFLIGATGQTHMIRIGESTYGSTGQPYSFDLPGGFTARVCAKKDTYPDGNMFVGVGIIPDIKVAPTVQDFIDHKDPALQKALDYIQSKLGK